MLANSLALPEPMEEVIRTIIAWRASGVRQVVAHLSSPTTRPDRPANVGSQAAFLERAVSLLIEVAAHHIEAQPSAELVAVSRPPLQGPQHPIPKKLRNQRGRGATKP